MTDEEFSSEVSEDIAKDIRAIREEQEDQYNDPMNRRYPSMPTEGDL